MLIHFHNLVIISIAYSFFDCKIYKFLQKYENICPNWLINARLRNDYSAGTNEIRLVMNNLNFINDMTFTKSRLYMKYNSENEKTC